MGTVSGTRDVVSQSFKVKDGWVWSECLHSSRAQPGSCVRGPGRKDLVGPSTLGT